MAMLRGVRADLSSFAHLMGLAPKGRTASEAPEKTPEEIEDEEKKKDPAAEGEKEPDAAAPEDDKTAEGEKTPEEVEEEDEEEQMQKARAAERARCRAIFAAPAAGKNPALAAHLAFDTDLTAEQAVSALALSGAAGGGLGARMAGAPNPALGSGGGAKPAADDSSALVQRILASAAKARGGKP